MSVKEIVWISATESFHSPGSHKNGLDWLSLLGSFLDFGVRCRRLFQVAQGKWPDGHCTCVGIKNDEVVRSLTFLSRDLRTSNGESAKLVQDMQLRFGLRKPSGDRLL